MYLSNLHASADGRNSVQDKACLDSFTKLMNQLIFTGLDKKPTLKAPPQMDHQLPLMILAGSDKFNDIGRPRGAVDDNIAAGLQEWCELYEKMFPSKDSATARTKSSKFLIDDQFKDEGKIMQKVCGDFPSSFLYKYTQHKDFFSAIYS
jgi:dynein light intermediate chain 2